VYRFSALYDHHLIMDLIIFLGIPGVDRDQNIGINRFDHLFEQDLIAADFAGAAVKGQ
jgi:hypothetical protein